MLQQFTQNLNTFKQQFLNCCKCELCHTRTNVIFGEGPVNPDLMIVGQCPTSQEDKVGRPFIGNEGQILNSLLDKSGIVKDKVYITNSLLCYVKPGIEPDEEYIDACQPRLHEEISLVNPKVILTLGKTAIRAVSGKQISIWYSRTHFALFNNKIYYTGTYHPAAALYYGRTGGILDNIIDDMIKCRNKIAELKRRRQILLNI